MIVILIGRFVCHEMNLHITVSSKRVSPIGSPGCSSSYSDEISGQNTRKNISEEETSGNEESKGLYK